MNGHPQMPVPRGELSPQQLADRIRRWAESQGYGCQLGPHASEFGTVRVTEVLSAGKTGRTCHRAGPAIAIGRTGCDMNFPADGLMGAKHTEVRLSEDGAATLVDLGQGSGVFIRVRAQSQLDLHAGDILMMGDQQLRVEVG